MVAEHGLVRTLLRRQRRPLTSVRVFEHQGSSFESRLNKTGILHLGVEVPHVHGLIVVCCARTTSGTLDKNLSCPPSQGYNPPMLPEDLDMRLQAAGCERLMYLMSCELHSKPCLECTASFTRNFPAAETPG